MKVSLITCTRNSAATIADTLASVRMQRYPHIEHIIVDGLSTDDTLHIVCANKPAHRQVVISEADCGIYDAMNKGIRMATGDIVGIINSDDFYHWPDVIERVVEAFADGQVQAVFGDVRFVRSTNPERTVRYYSSRRFTPALFRWGFMPAHPTFFTYKRHFDAFGYYKTDYRIAADYELLIRFLYTQRLPYKYLPFDFMKMRTGGVSTASPRSTLILNREIIRACRENGIRTNGLMIGLKYFIKVFELIRLKNNK